MLKDFIDKGLKASKAAADAISDVATGAVEVGKKGFDAAVDAASDVKLGDKVYIPGMVRAAATLHGLLADSKAQSILIAIGITTKADLEAVRWMCREEDIIECRKLFQ
jgi:hypothetical protein